ncbi:MAG: MaoC family dehydratase N-terminal domain-containing protein [Oscillospiraceae bacterium]|nr:MaoC family dehydratase N-terminal domain-containing protein [Oscillospiraceae bacterium]
MNEFEIFYPGVYNDTDKKILDDFRRSLEDGSWLATGPMPMNGVETADREAMRKWGRIWNPYNPLYWDEDYAKTTKWGDIIASPGMFEPDVWFPMMPRTLGIWGMDRGKVRIPGNAMDHEMYYYKPIYPGDVLSTKNVHLDFEDVTDPAGSDVRAFRVCGEGDFVNQRGEVAGRGVFRTVEMFKRYTDPSRNIPMLRAQRHMSDYHPCHIYTDEDWELIKDMWRNEYVRGKETLYWEDVSIGDEPTPTADGPYTAITMFYEHGDMIFEQPRIRDAVMTDRAQRCEKDETGCLYHDWAQHFCDRNHPGSRPVFVNTTARNHAIRMLTNWCGDNGFVTKIGWRLISERAPEDACDMFPATYDRPSVLLKVPYMKNRYLNAHGMVNDLVISRGYVYDKYIKDGKHYVDLACWCENLDGNIIQECPATVMLSSKEE